MPTVADNLRAAGELIARPGGWIKSVYARTSKGRTIGPTCKGAVYFCAAGAIRKCNGQSIDGTPELKLLAEAAGLEDYEEIAEWNDAPERTQAEVVEAFRKAAELAEERGL